MKRLCNFWVNACLMNFHYFSPLMQKALRAQTFNNTLDKLKTPVLQKASLASSKNFLYLMIYRFGLHL